MGGRESALEPQRGSSERSSAERVGGRTKRSEYGNKTIGPDPTDDGQMWCHPCSFAGATKLHVIFIELILDSLAQKRKIKVTGRRGARVNL